MLRLAVYARRRRQSLDTGLRANLLMAVFYLAASLWLIGALAFLGLLLGVALVWDRAERMRLVKGWP